MIKLTKTNNDKDIYIPDTESNEIDYFKYIIILCYSITILGTCFAKKNNNC